MEVSGVSDVSGSYTDHDVLFGDRRVDRKYFCVYLASGRKRAAGDGYFTSFITSKVSPIVFMLVFLALTAWIVYRGCGKRN